MPVRIPVALSLLCVAVSAVLLVFPSLGGLDPRLGRGAGAVALGIGLWATGVIPEYLTAIIFFFVALVFSVAAPTVVLAGFYSGAVWLVFGGLVMGTAAQKSGLGDRIAELVLRHLPSSYVGILGVLVLVALVLSFLIPSGIGRLALLIPLVVSLGRQLGFAPGSRGHTGLVMAAGMATIMPSNAILTANVPPIVLAGAAESIFGLKISYLKYLLLNMPVLGAGSAVIIVVLCALMFHQQPRPVTSTAARAPWSASQRRVLLIMIAAVALWMTDSLHGIAPAWVAMGAAILCLLPRSGILAPRDMVESVNYAPWFFIAGVVGLGAVATDSGLGSSVGRLMLAELDLSSGGIWRNYAVITAMSVVVGLITTIGALPAVMTPLAQSIAEATGWNVNSVLMAQVPAYLFYLLPYQVPPVILTISMAGLAMSPVVRFLALHFVLGMVIIVPLHFHWAAFLGYLP